MGTPMIKVNGLTKDYGKGRGLFDVSFEVKDGCIFGYCGTNGSGKTTTIRALMGFIKGDKGTASINGLDAYKDSEAIKSFVGYVPGEIAFPDLPSGTDFLKSQAKMLGMNDFSKAERIISALQLDPTASLKRMSKGMKQKVALVNAFMNDPKVLLLDEPTTGLDPLMRASFISLLLEEKAKGTTIFMSSHMFSEMEETCDYVGLLRDGKLLEVVDMEALKNRQSRLFRLAFDDASSYLDFKLKGFRLYEERISENVAVYDVRKADLQRFFASLKGLKVASISEKSYTLQNRFEEVVIKGGNENGTNGK